MLNEKEQPVYVICKKFNNSINFQFTEVHKDRTNQVAEFVKHQENTRKRYCIVRFPDGVELIWRTSALEEYIFPSKEENTPDTIEEETFSATETKSDKPYISAELKSFQKDVFSELAKAIQAEKDFQEWEEEMKESSNLTTEFKKGEGKQLDLFDNVPEDDVINLSINISELLDMAGDRSRIISYIDNYLDKNLYPKIEETPNNGYSLDENNEAVYINDCGTVDESIYGMQLTQKDAKAYAALSKLIRMQREYNKTYIGNTSFRYCITYTRNYAGHNNFIVEDCGLRHRVLWFYNRSTALYFLREYNDLIRTAAELI